jgi:hypothetical protein
MHAQLAACAFCQHAQANCARQAPFPGATAQEVTTSQAVPQPWATSMTQCASTHSGSRPVDATRVPSALYSATPLPPTRRSCAVLTFTVPGMGGSTSAQHTPPNTQHSTAQSLLLTLGNTDGAAALRTEAIAVHMPCLCSALAPLQGRPQNPWQSLVKCRPLPRRCHGGQAPADNSAPHARAASSTHVYSLGRG